MSAPVANALQAVVTCMPRDQWMGASEIARAVGGWHRRGVLGALRDLHDAGRIERQGELEQRKYRFPSVAPKGVTFRP